MITAETRRCGACPELLEPDQLECPKCGHRKAPRVEDWPVGAKRFLCMLIVVDAVVTRIDLTEDQQFSWLLENAFRGRRFNGESVPFAATAADCYPHFVDTYRRWQEAGAPTDFAAIARLRASR